MSGLPEGWEADYDGRRWFYTYQPNGHIQYHFPSEGDEFPDFVDPSSPAPNLAPEERLQSQQQVRRHGSSQAGRFPRRNLSPYWDDQTSVAGFPGSTASQKDRTIGLGQTESRAREEHDAAAEIFQPESLMFLGPSAYNDVSPLEDENEEEEEAVARRTISGAGTSPRKSSPRIESQRYATGTFDGHIHDYPPHQMSVDGTRSDSEATSQGNLPPHARILTEREVPSRQIVAVQWIDPVGRIPEMASAETARAYIETNPDPVEAPDNSVLAPIEVSTSTNIAELAAPDESETSDHRRVLSDTTLSHCNKASPVGMYITKPLLETGKEGRTRYDTGHDKPPLGHIRVPLEKLQTPGGLEIDPKHYRPYHPRHASPSRASNPRGLSRNLRSSPTSLQREGSLLLGSGFEPHRDPEAVPSVLATPSTRPDMPPVQQHRQASSQVAPSPVDSVRIIGQEDSLEQGKLVSEGSRQSIPRRAVRNTASQPQSTTVNRLNHGQEPMFTENKVGVPANFDLEEPKGSLPRPRYEQPSTVPPYPCSPVLAQRKPLIATALDPLSFAVPSAQPPWLATGPASDIQRRPSAISRKAVPDHNPTTDMSMADEYRHATSVEGVPQRKPCLGGPAVAACSSRPQSLSAGIIPPAKPFDSPNIPSPSNAMFSVPSWTRRLGKQAMAARFSRSTSLYLGRTAAQRALDHLGNMTPGFSSHGKHASLDRATATHVVDAHAPTPHQLQQPPVHLHPSYSVMSPSSITRKAVQSMKPPEHATE